MCRSFCILRQDCTAVHTSQDTFTLQANTARHTPLHYIPTCVPCVPHFRIWILAIAIVSTQLQACYFTFNSIVYFSHYDWIIIQLQEYVILLLLLQPVYQSYSPTWANTLIRVKLKCNLCVGTRDEAKQTPRVAN